ncbi:MAG: hypothetical protein WAM66_07020 [Acidobacteriaceae bacterium]
MSLVSVIAAIEQSGGVLKLEPDERIRVLLPPGMEGVSSILREHKPALLAILRQRGGRIAAFPHCPRCASYALYRKDNLGDYECQTCGMQGIEESTARRVQ